MQREFQVIENAHHDLSEKFRDAGSQLNESKNKLNDSIKSIDEKQIQLHEINERFKAQEKITLDTQQIAKTKINHWRTKNGLLIKKKRNCLGN